MTQAANKFHIIPSGDEEAGSIGIGAMIVFIALILVAAVASTIIIKTAEELQQNAESTSQDTRDQISGKVSITDVYSATAQETLDDDGSGDTTGDDTDIATFDVIARMSSGSLNVFEGDITWYITCQLTYSPGTTTFVVVDTAEADTTELDGTDIADGDEITAGTTFRFTITLTTSDTDGDDEISATDFTAPTVDGDTPGCGSEAGVGAELGIRLVVDGGGETLATLKITSLSLGKSVM